MNLSPHSARSGASRVMGNILPYGMTFKPCEVDSLIQTMICSKCGKDKPVDAFYGFHKQCTACRVAYNKRLRAKSRITQEGRAMLRRWHKNRNSAVRRQRYRDQHPDRYRAHVAIQCAIARAAIVRPEICEACNQQAKTQAHHPDYSKPLEVQWLCRACHLNAHGKQSLTS